MSSGAPDGPGRRRHGRRLLATLALVAPVAAVAAAVLGWSGGHAPPPAVAAVKAVRASTLSAPHRLPAKTATAFVAPGASGDKCTRDAPCGSVDAAVRAADTGAVVELAAGTYPAQVVGRTRKAGAGTVVVRPAPGARVVLGQVSCGEWSGDAGPSRVELRDLTVRGALIHVCDRWTLRNVQVTGAVYLEGSTNFSMVGGSVGPGADFHPDVSAVYNSDPPIVPRNVLFDRVRFHDWSLQTPGKHVECLQISDVRTLVVRRSRFERCDTFDLHVGGTVAGPVRDILIEDNDFGTTGDHSNSAKSYYSLSVRDGVGVTIARNRSAQGWALPARDGVAERWTITHNIAPMERWQCDERIRWVRNRWTNARCSSSDRRAPLPAAVQRLDG